jgi:hypothetical protein
MPLTVRLATATAAALVLLLSLAAAAQPLDTPERRAALAQQLVDAQWPETKRSILGMVEGFESQIPPEQRPAFQANFDRLFDFEQVRRVSAQALAKDLTADELAALVQFYSSPLGHSAMTKMPQVMQDTLPLVQSLMMNTLKQMPPPSPPPPNRNL